MSQPVIAKIARLTGVRQLQMEEEMLDPAQLADHELLAETIVTAMSVGTELAAYTGKAPLRPGPIYPRVVGYCNIARIRVIGRSVTRYQPGDCILTFQSHRSAFICPESAVLLKVDPAMDLGAAATTYLFNLGYSSLLNSDFQPGHHVAVIGLGILGMGTVAVAANASGRVAAFSNQAVNLELAKKLGATHGISKSDEDAFTRYIESTGQGGADLAILTSDTWEDWLLALKVLRRKGTLGVISFPGRGQPSPAFNPLDSQYFYDKHLRILSAAASTLLDVPADEIRFNRQRNCSFLLEQIASGRLPARALISGEHDWRDLEFAYQSLENRSGGEFTRLIHWNTAEK